MRLVLVAGAVAIVLAAAAVVAMRGESAARDGTTVRTSNGVFELTVSPEPRTSPVNRLHSWTLVLRRDGEPVTGARIAVGGDMPAHGHGLPTQPLVRELGGGRYSVDGMKFQMGGEWYVSFAISAGDRYDTARVEFVLAE